MSGGFRHASHVLVAMSPEKLKIYLAKDRSVTSKRDTSLPGRGVKFYLYYLYRLLLRRGSKGTCHSLGRYFIFISPRTSYSAPPPTNRHSPSHLTFLPHVTQFTEITFSLGGKFHFASACSTCSSLALLLLRALLIFSELNVGHLPQLYLCSAEFVCFATTLLCRCRSFLLTLLQPLTFAIYYSFVFHIQHA